MLFFRHGLTNKNNARPHVTFHRKSKSCTKSRTVQMSVSVFSDRCTLYSYIITDSQCRIAQEGAMRNREINHHINTHTQLVARLARCRRGRDRHYGVTELPSSGTWPPRLRYAPWCLRPPARTAGGASTRSRHGATCTGTTPGAPWASTRSSAAAAPGASALAAPLRATATTRPPAAAPAAWPPRSPAESAADPDDTCSRPSKPRAAKLERTRASDRPAASRIKRRRRRNGMEPTIPVFSGWWWWRRRWCEVTRRGGKGGGIFVGGGWHGRMVSRRGDVEEWAGSRGRVGSGGRGAPGRLGIASPVEGVRWRRAAAC